jgi:PhzF family phenazine biosynthesis protein
MEVDLCGHATLASAHALAAELGAPSSLGFDTLSGLLTVDKVGDRYCLDFPLDGARAIPEPQGLADALGVKPLEVWAGQFVVAILADEAGVRALKPDQAALKSVEGGSWGAGHVCVAALADAGRPYAVVSRFFCPGLGIAEDPTTGATHCMLGPLFGQKLGKSRLAFHQAFPGRGGDMEVEVRGDRVSLIGQAVTVVESRLRL